MGDYIQVFTTTETKGDCERIANTLLKKRVAGCVQILGPILSTYWWKGNVETTEEWLCIIKSKRDLYSEIEKAIKHAHPYETPEIISMPIIDGSKEYLNWLSNKLEK